MSDFSTSIVPKLTVYPNAQQKIDEILQWLIAEDVVKPEPSDCVLGSSVGYAISDGAANVVDGEEDLPLDLWTNGLEIANKRTVFHTGENGIDAIICPACNANIVEDDWNLEAWNEEQSNNLVCPSCNLESDIQLFEFSPEWGFSNIGFTFWNWPPFKDEFINQFKERLGCDVRIVESHL